MENPVTPKKKSSVWMWIIIMVLLALAIIVGIVVYKNRKFLNAPAVTTPPAPDKPKGGGMQTDNAQ